MNSRAVLFASMLLSFVVGCGAAQPELNRPSGRLTPQEDADALLAFYNPIYLGLYRESALASWAAGTDVSERNTGLRTGANTAFSAFAGNAELIRRARALLTHEDELSELTRLQLRQLLYLAADAPQLDPALARARIAAEARQSELLDGFQFCLRREGERCLEPAITNDIDNLLVSSTDLTARERVWNASKEVGKVLLPGIMELRGLRNAVTRQMGYSDFFSFQVSNYGMTSEEMMQLLDRLIEETKPLYSQLQCWTRHELARRYGVTQVPRLIPAHWIGNRWAQEWPGLVSGVDMDAMVAGKTPEWIVRQAERFYTSMGFEALPESFWTDSDLYPVPDGQTRKKNAHASAWHLDLEHDVRSLMSVESDWRWFGTTHHELGHIYYYLSYARPEVPPLLREGANRSYHEGMGDLIALASSQSPYLREIGLLAEGQEIDEQRWLLDSALTGPITFLPFAAGTMAHFEKALYADELSEAEINTRWWELVARYQGVAPPTPRPADTCDACTKTHINDDPGQYYDYALANVLVFQLHDHICRQILHQDPHACNYYGRREVGDFLRAIMRPGMSRDWRTVLREHTGQDLSAAPMLEYYRPLLAYLEEQNRGKECGW